MKNMKVHYVPIGDIVCPPQARESTGFSPGDIARLGQSIKSGGIRTPLLVRRHKGKLEMIDGERRWRAAEAVGLTVVPVIIVEDLMSDAEVTCCQLVLDAQRVDLSAMERARSIDRLMREGEWSAARVAAETGLSEPQVSKHLTLLVLPEIVQQRIMSGQLAMSTAYELAKIPVGELREQLIAEALNGRLTRSAVLRKLKESQGSRSARPRERARRRRRHLVLPIDAVRSLKIQGKGLTLHDLVTGLQTIIGKLNDYASQDLSLEDAVAALQADES